MAAPATDKHRVIEQVLAQQRQRYMRTWIALGSMTLVGLMVVWTLVSDDPMPADDDLRVAIPVGVSDSAAPPRAPDILRLALDSAHAVDSNNLMGQPPWTWDTPLLARTVQDNAMLLDNLRDLLSQTQWQPHHPAWMAEDLGNHSKWDDLATAKEAAITYFARQNDEEAAMKSVLDLAVLARHLQSASSASTLYARGIELHQRACANMAELLRKTRLSSLKLEMYQEAFAQQAPSNASLQEALVQYYQFERQFILGDAGAVHHPGRFLFKPHQTLQLFVRGFRSLRNEIPKAPYARVYAIPSLVGNPGSPPGNTTLSTNRSGYVFANTRLWAYTQLVDRQGLQSTRHSIVQTLFAVRRYAADHARLPGTLSDMVPTYMRELPIDPYTSGQPLHYDPQRSILYSAGQDYKDQGGHLGTTPLGDAYEPTVSVK